MTAARILREARRRAGSTQRELAARAAVPQSVVARIESGRSTPRVDTLERLLDACDLRLDAGPVLGRGVDRGQIRERRRWTPRERLEALAASAQAMQRIRGRARKSQARP